MSGWMKKMGGLSMTAFLYWLSLATGVGLVCGVGGVLFSLALEFCQELRERWTWLVWLLPAAGWGVAALYHYIGQDKDRGTDMVLAAVRDNKQVPAITAPLIFSATCLTHLAGGSAGREGAALQLGGSIASFLSRYLRLDREDYHVFIMCGVAAGFSAIFGAPITAAVFVLEVVSVGEMCYAAFVPCLISSLSASLLARGAGLAPVAYFMPYVRASLPMLLQVVALGLLCAGVSVGFCRIIQKSGSFMNRVLPNIFFRAMVGGAILLLLTQLVGTYDYNGAGMEQIRAAIAGKAQWYDCLLKLVFTAITLGCGFKGGELIPSFFVGATFGCAVAPLLGLEPGFAAGLGLLAVFCGITNCPLASIILGVELFGGDGLVFYAVACAVSYMMSGYYSLYGEQHFLFAKTKATSFFRPANRG